MTTVLSTETEVDDRPALLIVDDDSDILYGTCERND